MLTEEESRCLIDQIQDMIEQVHDLQNTIVVKIPCAISMWWTTLPWEAKLAAICKTCEVKNYSTAHIQKYIDSIIWTRIMKNMSSVPTVRGTPKLIYDIKKFLDNIKKDDIPDEYKVEVEMCEEELRNAMMSCTLVIGKTIASELFKTYQNQLSR